MPKKLTASERHIRDRVKRDAQKLGNMIVARRNGATIMRDAYSVTAAYKRIHMIEDKYRGLRLRRRAYVCDGSEVQEVNDIGYTSITDAFISRPRDCKYCVFDKTDGSAILVNMFELTQSGNPMELTVKPGAAMDFPNTDAAIMYALTIE